jgi:hypothetical protein
MGELGKLAVVPNKIKKTKNNSYPTDPIKLSRWKITPANLNKQKTPHSMSNHVELQQ